LTNGSHTQTAFNTVLVLLLLQHTATVLYSIHVRLNNTANYSCSDK